MAHGRACGWWLDGGMMSTAFGHQKLQYRMIILQENTAVLLGNTVSAISFYTLYREREWGIEQYRGGYLLHWKCYYIPEFYQHSGHHVCKCVFVQYWLAGTHKLMNHHDKDKKDTIQSYALCTLMCCCIHSSLQYQCNRYINYVLCIQ